MKNISTLVYNLAAVALLVFGGLCVIGAACVPAGFIYGAQQKWLWFSILVMLLVMLFTILIYYRMIGKIKSFLSLLFIILLGVIFGPILEFVVYSVKAAKRVRASNPIRPTQQKTGSALVLAGVLLSTFSLPAIILAVNAENLRGFWADNIGLWNLMIVVGMCSTLAGTASLNGDMRLATKK